MSNKSTESASLKFHELEPRGKVGISVTKDVESNISLAYSPGVAEPCLEIGKDPENALRYTNLGNRVAIISDGTAILGLGNISPIASKPVLEGKCALFKVLAGIDCTDLVVRSASAREMADHIKAFSGSFSGIMLEDISAPTCFELEEILQQELDIPVFHDDQHGTAVVCVAALLNSIKRSKKELASMKVVGVGAGAAGLACLDLMIEAGIKKENISVFDTKGIIHRNRTDLNKYKGRFSVDRNMSLPEALVGADIFLGTSVGNTLKPEWIKEMAPDPLILALANPTPEIDPKMAKDIRPDCMICTGRSDYPNQVNNVFCFPYLFRVLLDYSKQLKLTNQMKLAVSRAICTVSTDLMPKSTDISVRYLMPGLILKELGFPEYKSYNRARLGKFTGIQNPKQYIDFPGCGICDEFGLEKITFKELEKLGFQITTEPTFTGAQWLSVFDRPIWLPNYSDTSVGGFGEKSIYYNAHTRLDDLLMFSLLLPSALKLDQLDSNT